MSNQITRRHFVGATGAVAGLMTLASSPALLSAQATSGAGFKYSLNTATIRGQKLPLPEQFDVAAKAGYDFIEPWLGDVAKYAESNSLKDLRRRAEDQGLKVISGIGFPEWGVNDDARRARAMEQLKREMDFMAQLGAPHIAAPPAGIYGKEVKVELDRLAERYRAVLEVGRQMQVIPMLEIWGASANLNNLADATYVITKSGHPDACLLADVYHVYRGGSDFASLRVLGPTALRVFHMNDYPATPPRESLRDSDRIWPGDGQAPMKEIFSHFLANGSRPVLSLELFNAEYYKMPALDAARTGLNKMKACVASAVS